MKQKKLFIFLLAIIMVFSICMPAFAENVIDASNHTDSYDPTSSTSNNTTTGNVNSGLADNSITSLENQIISNSEGEQNTVSSDGNQIAPTVEENKNTIASEDLAMSAYFVNSDMYFANDTVTVDMPVNGNVFIFGSDVTISNTINGDVFVMGDKVNIDSNAVIYGSIFAFANTLTLNGRAYDVYVAGNQMVLGSNAYLYRDLKSYTSSLSLNGTITRNVYSTANEIAISDTTKIGRDFEYSSKNEITIPEGVVTGNVNFHQVKKVENAKTFGDYASAIISQAIFVFAIFLVCLGIAPKFGKKVSTVLQKKWGASIGLGLAGVIGIPLFAFLLLTTGIATNLSIYTFTLYGLLLATGFSVVCIGITYLLAEKFKFSKQWMTMVCVILIAIILGLLKLIPFVAFLLTTFGVGMLIVSLFYQPEKKKA